ncbi:MAG: FecR domain-containing protein [Candidatus Omnitrophica bacterium]|nr:FecR domain-containing protein [Candidatus Omnitrophota bacterium]
MKGTRFLAILLLSSFIFFANLFCQSKTETEHLVRIKVEKGDYLIRVCKKYLENPEKWPEIAKINKLKNPDVILPSQVLLFPASMMKGTPVSGTVTFLKGTADFKTQDKEEWIPLNTGDKIKEGSLIRTGAESSMEIKFEDGNVFMLKENTTVGFQTARKTGDNYSKYKMSLNMGKLVSNIQKTEKQETAVQIESPTAVVGVRGTVFRSSVDEKGTSQIEVLEGSVVVEGEKGKVELKKGEGTIVEKGKPPTPPQKLLAPPVPVELSDSIYTRLPINLSFDAVEEAVSYKVALAKDKDIKDIVREKVIAPQETFEIRDVEDGTYFIQTASIDKRGFEGMPSETFRVRIRLNPSAPFIEIPRDEGIYTGTSLTCIWLKVPDASGYRVRITEHIQTGKHTETTRVVLDKSDISATEYTIENIPLKRYYFQVRAVAADGYQGEWSEIIHFTLKMPPPQLSPGTPEPLEKEQNEDK